VPLPEPGPPRMKTTVVYLRYMDAASYIKIRKINESLVKGRMGKKR
jgi:hypothetical protein